MSDVVPFGKYKGKSLEAMLQDRQYIEWLMGQSWFQQHNLYTIVVNNFGEASETPEHNAMQALFLDENVKRIFAFKAFGGHIQEAHGDKTFSLQEEVENIKKDIVRISEAIAKPEECPWDSYKESDLKIKEIELQNKINDVEKHQNGEIKWEIRALFEHGDVDVVLKCKIYKGLSWCSDSFNIELKPQVGDDYPAVLRAMLRKKCGILVLKQYTGTGATQEQFIEIFRSSGIRVVFLDEIAPPGSGCGEEI